MACILYLISYDLPAYYDISLQKLICFQSALKHRLGCLLNWEKHIVPYTAVKVSHIPYIFLRQYGAWCSKAAQKMKGWNVICVHLSFPCNASQIIQVNKKRHNLFGNNKICCYISSTFQLKCCYSLWIMQLSDYPYLVNCLLILHMNIHFMRYWIIS